MRVCKDQLVTLHFTGEALVVMGSKKKASKKKKSKQPKQKGAKPILVPIKIPPTQLRALKLQAKKYADGNLSAWLRHAGLRYRPKRGEVVETVTMPSGKTKRNKKR